MNSRKFVDNLKKLVTIQSESYNTRDMARYIVGVVQSIGGCTITNDKYGNIYVTKGNADKYDSMVCHIDTVHSIVKARIHAINIDGNIVAFNGKTMKQHGTGGDDKVGIHITLELLKRRSNFKAVFFLDEEVGCVGSAKADFKFFNDCRFVLECDRRGSNDFVDSISGTQLYSKEFSKDIQKVLQKYNRKEVSGGMTDVVEIAYSTNKCVANMSCGYYNPHTDTEYINIEDVIDTFNFCNDLYDINKKMYSYDVARVNQWANYRWDYDPYYGTNDAFDHYDLLDDSNADKKIKEICGPGCMLHDNYCTTCMMYTEELTEFFEDETTID